MSHLPLVFLPYRDLRSTLKLIPWLNAIQATVYPIIRIPAPGIERTSQNSGSLNPDPGD
jgi:hypothetical protein